MAYLYITGTIEIEIPEIEGMNMPQFTAEAQAILLIGVGIIDSIIILLNMIRGRPRYLQECLK